MRCIAVTEFEHFFSFSLIEGRQVRTAQYHKRDTIADGRTFSLKQGAVPIHINCRWAHAEEPVRVDGTVFSNELLGVLEAIPTALAA